MVTKTVWCFRHRNTGRRAARYVVTFYDLIEKKERSFPACYTHLAELVVSALHRAMAIKVEKVLPPLRGEDARKFIL